MVIITSCAKNTTSTLLGETSSITIRGFIIKCLRVFLLLDTYLAGSGLIGISLSILSRALLRSCEIGTVICCDFPPFYPHCSCTGNRKAKSSLPSTANEILPWRLETNSKLPMMLTENIAPVWRKHWERNASSFPFFPLSLFSYSYVLSISA